VALWLNQLCISYSSVVISRLVAWGRTVEVVVVVADDVKSARVAARIGIPKGVAATGKSGQKG